MRKTEGTMEYIRIDKESPKGTAALSSDVFKNIVQIEVSRNEDVIPAKKENDYVTSKLADQQLTLNLLLKLRLGCNVAEVCGNLQDKIHEDILWMTGVDCKDINLDIVGFVTDKNEK